MWGWSGRSGLLAEGTAGPGVRWYAVRTAGGRGVGRDGQELVLKEEARGSEGSGGASAPSWCWSLHILLSLGHFPLCFV